MTKTHARRLLKLANRLETVPRKKFNLAYWKDETECGTVACACGWACTIQEFKNRGLGLTDGFPILKYQPTTPAEKALAENTYRKVFGPLSVSSPDKFYRFTAASMFFGLSAAEATHLFQDDSYYKHGRLWKATPKAVAKRIREVVKKYHPNLYRQDRLKRLAAS